MFHGENNHAVEMVEIISSSKLQQIIFYQGMYSLLYFAVCGGCLLNKLYNYEFQKRILSILTLPIFSLWCFTEMTRIALGYIGNMMENVPMIAAFLLLTIFPQLVAVLFFTFLQSPVFPFDSGSGLVMTIFLLVELFVGRKTFKELIERQTAQFVRLCLEAETERTRQVTG